MANECGPQAERASLAERVASRLIATGIGQQARAPAPVCPVEMPPSAPAVAVAGAEVAEAPARPAGPMVEINLNRLQAAGFITPDSATNRLTEEFRLIKRQLLAGAFPKGESRPVANGHVIMITSSQPGEGKTFTSLNLAMSMSSERGLHVLLVDGDSHRHSLANQLEVSDRPGLVDLLVDKNLTVRDVLLRTNIPNLAFLPAGNPDRHATELLASKQMAALMRDLAVRYADRVIIIDTPPVLASTEAPTLAAHVGQTVVVVEQHRTSKRWVEKTLNLLQGCPNVSCILNMVPNEIGNPRYDYYDHRTR